MCSGHSVGCDLSVRETPQLEKLVDEALKHNDFQALDEFLQDESKDGTNSKCSKQFITKLDKLMNRELDHRNIKHACLGLTILHKFGETMIIPGGKGISVMVSQGLVKKWFEKARELWVEEGTRKNEALLNLAEDFFDALMVVHESSKEGTYHITEYLLHHTGKLSSDPQVHIMIQKEAVRKLNVILDKIPIELKKEKKILSSQEASGVMNNLASRILEGGDYDLQIALMEALCRMTTRAQRGELADHWFTMGFVADAFSKIQDSEFETDCRKFLNLVNGMQGDARKVYSYPCLEVFLDKHELLMPADEKLEEFWIDFNLGSQCISFYFSLADEEAQEGQWDTLCIPENEVYSYTVKEEKGRKVLTLVLSDPLCVNGIEGSKLTILFSSSLDIMQATRNVYGNAKNKMFVGKSSTSVVKTTVQIILDEANSQVLVPESQVSQTQRAEGDPFSSVMKKGAPCQALPHPAPREEGGTKNLLPQIVTPARMKVSQSSTFISSSVGRKLGGSFSSSVLETLSPKTKGKPALHMVTSSERKREFDLRELMMAKSSCSVTSQSVRCETRREQQSYPAAAQEQSTAIKLDSRKGREAEKFRRHIPTDKVLEMVQTDQYCEEEPLDNSMNIVPDSQPTMNKEYAILPGLWSTEPSKRKISVTEALLPWQRECSQGLSKPDHSIHPALSVELPKRPSSATRGSGELGHRQLHAQLTQRLEQVLRDRDQETPSQKEPQRKGPSAGKKRSSDPGSGVQRPVKAQTRPTQKSQKPTPTKPLQEITPNARTKGTGSHASKEKKAAEVTGSMVKLISSHYNKSTVTAAAPGSGSQLAATSTKRSLFDKRWSLTFVENGGANSSGFLKSYNHPKKAIEQPEDVYAFELDSPKTNGRKVTKSAEKSGIESSALSISLMLSSSAKKTPTVKPPGRHVKKHLFSDTDTDNVTEVSWLRASSRRPKAKVADYSRQPAKPLPPADTTYESPDIPLPSPKPVKEQPKAKKRKKKTTEQKESKGSTAGSKPSRRPQRAAAMAKSYREPDSDNFSQSESEEPPAPKKWVIGQPERNQKTALERAIGQTERSERNSPDIDVRKKTVPELEVKKRIIRELEVKKRNVPELEMKKRKTSPDLEMEKRTVPELEVKKRTVPELEVKKRTMRELEVKKRNVPELEVKKRKTSPDLEMEKRTVPELEVKKRTVPELEVKTRTVPELHVKKRTVPELVVKKRKTSPDLEMKKRTVPELEVKKRTPVLQDSTNRQTESWAARLASFCPTPPSIERMRFAETFGTSPRSPITPLRSLSISPAAPSPPLEVPKPLGGIQASSFYKTVGSSDKVKPPSLTPIVQTPSISAQKPSASEQAQLSPVPSLQSPAQPLLTSTALQRSSETSLLKSPDLVEQLRDFVNNHEGLQASFDKESVISMVTLSQSSYRSVNNVAMLCIELEKTPSSNRESEHSKQCEFQSGPSFSWKRHSSHHTSTLSEEEEEEDRGMPSEQAIKMKPRKLFKPTENWAKEKASKSNQHEARSSTKQPLEKQSSSEEEVEEVEVGKAASRETMKSYHRIQKQSTRDTASKSKQRLHAQTLEEQSSSEEEVEEVEAASRETKKSCHRIQKQSTRDTVTVENVEMTSMVSSHMVSSCWEADVQADLELTQTEMSTSQEMNYVCRQFSTELQRKFQNRSRQIDLYTKQSLNAVQQHVSSISMQVHEYRSQRLEKVKRALMDEINNLEQDDSALKNMQKELTSYMKKQSLAFHSYQERETGRLQHLRNTFQTNMCHSVEYEEHIFTSEMCLMRKDMKSVQDRFFKEMQEEEMSGVRRGLQTLFLPEAPRF